MKAVLITSSILILVIAALRPILRGRSRPLVQYALWIAVAVRLLVPVEWASSAYSALALLDRAEEPARLAQSIGQTVVPIPAMSYEDAYDQALREYHQDKPLTTSFTDLEEVERRAQELQDKTPTLAELAAKYARSVWLGGAAVMGLWFLLVNLRLRRKLRTALPVEADCPLPVRVSPELPSPCLCGAIRPVIYVTPDALANPDRMRHVLAHELTHYRHGDHLWALVRCLCLCVYWFDPLVWWAAAMSRQDCELACDAGAIRRLGEDERLPYGRTLVAMISSGRNPLLQTATTMTGGKRRVKERVELIARRPKTAVALVLTAALVLGLTAGFTFTGAPEETPEPSQNLPADTLQERLLDVSENLPLSITATASETKDGINDIALASYWLDEPIEWIDEQNYWLFSVHRWERNRINPNITWPAFGEDFVDELIAYDQEFFYIIERPIHARFEMEDSEAFTAAYQAVRAYAEQQVLDTEGVEPFDPDQFLANSELQARLLDVPEELRDHVEARPDEDWDILVTYYFKHPGEEVDKAQYLLIVSRFREEEFRERYLTGGYAPVANGGTCFAKGGGYYYHFGWNTSIEYDLEDQELFTNASRAVREYAEWTVLETEGVEPFDLEAMFETLQPIWTAANYLYTAPSVNFRLTTEGPRSRSYTYSTVPSEDFYGHYLNALTVYFDVEPFDWGTTEDPKFPPASHSAQELCMELPDHSVYLRVIQGSDAIAVHDPVNGTNWYHCSYAYGDLDPTPFELVRNWFDIVELDSLQPTTVSDRGQSHEEIAREWAENWEGAMTRTTPGSDYACTYVRIDRVEADCHSQLSPEDMEGFAQYRGLVGADYGKTWFTFLYEAVVVPVDQSTASRFWAGNTGYYEGGDAPEGALTYGRVGYMVLTDEGWTCTGVGTGW